MVEKEEKVVELKEDIREETKEEIDERNTISSSEIINNVNKTIMDTSNVTFNNAPILMFAIQFHMRTINAQIFLNGKHIADHTRRAIDCFCFFVVLTIFLAFWFMVI